MSLDHLVKKESTKFACKHMDYLKEHYKKLNERYPLDE